MGAPGHGFPSCDWKSRRQSNTGDVGFALPPGTHKEGSQCAQGRSLSCSSWRVRWPSRRRGHNGWRRGVWSGRSAACADRVLGQLQQPELPNVPASQWLRSWRRLVLGRNRCERHRRHRRARAAAAIGPAAAEQAPFTARSPGGRATGRRAKPLPSTPTTTTTTSVSVTVVPLLLPADGRALLVLAGTRRDPPDPDRTVARSAPASGEARGEPRRFPSPGVREEDSGRPFRVSEHPTR